MSNKQNSTPSYNHGDSCKHEFGDIDDNGDDETSISYQMDATKYRKEDYGPVEQRGNDVEYEHPVDDVDELSHRAHLNAQLRVANIREKGLDPDLAKNADSATVAETFDNALLDVADFVLTNKGLSLDEVPERYIKALYLHDAWGYNSKPELVRQLEKRDDIAQRIGFDSVPTQSMFAKIESELETDGCRSQIRDAAIEAVHARFRRAKVVPEEVKEVHGLEFYYELDEREVDFETRQKELRDWVWYLLEETLAPFDFNRAEHYSNSVMAFFGLLAHCALQHCGLETGRPTARTVCPDDNVPSGSAVKKHILKKDLSYLREQFRETHNRFFQIVHNYGFTAEPRNVAFDPTTVNWYGEDDSWTIGSNANSNAEVWYFAGLGITDRESRFALGIHPVESKTKTTDHMQRFLRFTSQHFDIGSVYADAEFYDSDAVETCQTLARNTWIIRAKEKGDVKRMLQETPKGEIGRKPNIDLDGCSIEPNAFAIPTPHRSRSTTKWHTAYLTGHPLHDTDLEDLHSDYNERRSIEPLFDQIKNDFHIKTRSPERKARFFYTNTAMLYYNFHTLINRVPSPDYKLRLDVSSQRVLSAIRDVTIGNHSRL